jgi:hypothetical protein
MVTGTTTKSKVNSYDIQHARAGMTFGVFVVCSTHFSVCDSLRSSQYDDKVTVNTR